MFHKRFNIKNLTNNTYLFSLLDLKMFSHSVVPPFFLNIDTGKDKKKEEIKMKMEKH